MPNIELTCNYCGKEWMQMISYQSEMENLKCILCGDSNLKAKQLEDSKSDVFGYNSNDPKPDAYIKKN